MLEGELSLLKTMPAPPVLEPVAVIFILTWKLKFPAARPRQISEAPLKLPLALRTFAPLSLVTDQQAAPVGWVQLLMSFAPEKSSR